MAYASPASRRYLSLAPAMAAPGAAAAGGAVVVPSAAPAGKSRRPSSPPRSASVEDMDVDDGGSVGGLGRRGLRGAVFVVVVVDEDEDEKEDGRIAEEGRRGGTANPPIGGGRARTAAIAAATTTAAVLLVVVVVVLAVGVILSSGVSVVASSSSAPSSLTASRARAMLPLSVFFYYLRIDRRVGGKERRALDTIIYEERRPNASFRSARSLRTAQRRCCVCVADRYLLLTSHICVLSMVF